MTLAQRVAHEAGSGSLGEKVGYCVRFDDKSSPATEIKYVTDGMLLREATMADPLLSNYSVVVVDEAHERNLNSDAVLGLLKKIRRKRKDLRIIICSATIDAQAFLDFFVGPGREKEDTNKRKRRWGPSLTGKTIPITEKGTIISVDGRQHPVDVLYLAKPARDYIQSTVETCWQIHRVEKGGDILCFLASGEDIDHAIRLAEDQFQDVRQSVDLLPLYGTLPYNMQARVFESDPKRKIQRIIFATNIAETSVT